MNRDEKRIRAFMIFLLIASITLGSVYTIRYKIIQNKEASTGEYHKQLERLEILEASE